MNVKNKEPNKSKKAKLNRFDKTILYHTPKLFEMLGWMSLIGLFNYIAVLTNDIKIFALYFVSLCLFGLIGIRLFLFLQSVIPNIVAHT